MLTTVARLVVIYIFTKSIAIIVVIEIEPNMCIFHLMEFVVRCINSSLSLCNKVKFFRNSCGGSSIVVFSWMDNPIMDRNVLFLVTVTSLAYFSPLM
uniref:Putative secreted protein n=1 Tax=Anopheles darlingi TaxID=43151 RepID=A0A2M4DC68_ANODA